MFAIAMGNTLAISSFQNDDLIWCWCSHSCVKCTAFIYWPIVIIRGHKKMSKNYGKQHVINVIVMGHLEWNKRTAELKWTDPGIKDTGKFGTRGCIFPHNAKKWISIIPTVLVGKKHTKFIYDMPWLYQ